MSRQINDLMSQIIAAGKERGLSQAQLAANAGITAVGLSKAKARGDLLVSTLEKLAAQSGLELVLLPRRTREKDAEAIKSGAFFD